MLLSKNQGSHVVFEVDRPVPGGPSLFQRFFISFDAMIQGFMGGCRPFIGLDGCFMKNGTSGVILSSVSRDVNDQIFPLVFPVAESENKETWVWFLTQLTECIGISYGLKCTFISDGQKVNLFSSYIKLMSLQVYAIVLHTSITVFYMML